MKSMAKSNRFVQWFGSNTEHAEEPGKLLDGCKFVGIPFGGGMSEVPFITSKQILVSDAHRHVVNLCRVVADVDHLNWLRASASNLPYHPDILADAQREASEWDGGADRVPDRHAALVYFVCVWMGRGGKAGTADEFGGKLPIRWNANGGGSNRRYRTAVEALDAWGKAFRRCEFVCLDAFEFLGTFKDEPENGLLIDAPWPGAGDNYKHKFTTDDQRRLAKRLDEFKSARIVVRFGSHPLIEELYPRNEWDWMPLTSRNQANDRVEEWLITRRCEVS